MWSDRTAKERIPSPVVKLAPPNQEVCEGYLRKRARVVDPSQSEGPVSSPVRFLEYPLLSVSSAAKWFLRKAEQPVMKETKLVATFGNGSQQTFLSPHIAQCLIGELQKTWLSARHTSDRPSSRFRCDPYGVLCCIRYSHDLRKYRYLYTTLTAHLVFSLFHTTFYKLSPSPLICSFDIVEVDRPILLVNFILDAS